MILDYVAQRKKINIYWPYQGFVFYSVKNNKNLEDLEAFKAEYLSNAFQLTALY